MAFYSGLASSIDDLLVALQNACVAEGWSQNGSILYKNGCYVEFIKSSAALAVAGGTGMSGSTLTGKNATSTSSTIGGLPYLNASLMGVGSQITFPINYNIHIFNLEVYLIVRYGVDAFSYLAFGQLNDPKTGTGNWYAGLAGNVNPSYQRLSSLSLTDSFGGAGGSGPDSASAYSSGAIFSFSNIAGNVGNGYQGCNSFVHIDIDGNQWTQTGAGNTVGDTTASGWVDKNTAANSWLLYNDINPLMPSKWNAEAILLPIMPSISRSANKKSILGTIENARYLKIDNYEPEQIISLGETRWKVYPWFRKNLLASSASSTHSARFGWAIRYDGP